MWSSNRLNVGNEILKNHLVIIGHDFFIRLLRMKYGQ
jgi:hypothetical protein